MKTNYYFDTAFVFICLGFSTPRTTIAVGNNVGSLYYYEGSILSVRVDPISTRVATRTTTVNKSCSNMCGDQGPRWSDHQVRMADRIKVSWRTVVRHM